MINSGILRSRANILKRLPNKDQFGSQKPDYETVYDKWPCRMKDLSGSYASDDGVSVGTSQVELFGRYRDGVTKGMYAELRGVKMQVTDVRPNFDFTEMTIICRKEDDRL